MRRLALKTGLVAGILFALLTLFVRFPMQVDEFEFLSKAYSARGIHLIDFHAYLSGRPIFALINFLTFKWGWLKPNLLIPIYFFGYAISFALLAEWLIEKTGWDFSELNRQKRRLVAAALLTVIFFPSHHELLYETLNLPYQLGLIFLLLALRATNILSKGIFFGLSFLTLETYVFPAFLLPLVPFVLAKKKPDLKFLRSEWMGWVMGIILYQLIYRFDSALIGQGTFRSLTQIILSLNLHTLWIQFTLLMKFIWEIQFYKTNYVATALELSGWAVLVGTLIKKKELTTARTLALFAITLLSGAHNLLLTYYAPRAVFGAVIMKNLILFTLFFRFFSRINGSKILIGGALGCVLLSYLIQTSVVMRWKNFNYRVLQHKEVVIQKLLEQCNSPCNLAIHTVEDGFKYDYVISPLFEKDFLEWLRLKYAPQKQVTFVASDQTPEDL